MDLRIQTIDAYMQIIPPGSHSGRHRQLAEQAFYVYCSPQFQATSCSCWTRYTATGISLSHQSKPHPAGQLAHLEIGYEWATNRRYVLQGLHSICKHLVVRMESSHTSSNGLCKLTTKTIDLQT